VEAFGRLRDHKLVIAGDGPERATLQRLATHNVEFCGRVPDLELRKLMREARAFIFAAQEDFGITPVEAQSEGTPVIALGRGGARETIITEGAMATGIFFDEPTPAAIVDAICRFIQTEECYLADRCWENACRFSEERFVSAFVYYIQCELAGFARACLQTGTILDQRAHVAGGETF